MDTNNAPIQSLHAVLDMAARYVDQALDYNDPRNEIIARVKTWLSGIDSGWKGKKRSSTIHKQLVIERLLKIKDGIETDRFTMENIDASSPTSRSDCTG